MIKLSDEVIVVTEAVQASNSWAERSEGFAEACTGSEIRVGGLLGGPPTL